MRTLPRAVVLLTCFLNARVFAEELHFAFLFNGKDFAGWTPVNVAPDTFTIRDGVIHSTGFPTGILRTDRQYENFVIELDWMHEKPAGNAGLFLWGAPLTAPGTPFAKGIEIQILDDAYVTGEALEKRLYTGHGDVFPIHGATMKPDRPHPGGWDRCLPSENRANPAGKWNHYRVEARDGIVKLAVNGKVVSGGSLCNPRKGYLCLESEGSPAQFKNIRIAELPSTNPKPDACQPLAEDFTSLYTGIDLSNWVEASGHEGHWKPSDWVLAHDGKGEVKEKTLWTDKEYGDFVFIADWRLPVDPATGAAAGDRRGGILLRGDSKSVIELGPSAAAKPPGEWSRMIVTAKGDRVTVIVNGESLHENVVMTGVPQRGAIGLQPPDAPIEFANLFIRELK